MVAPAQDAPLPDRGPQRRQGRIVAPAADIDEREFTLMAGDGGLSVGGLHPGELAQRLVGGPVQLRVDAVTDEGTAESEYRRLVGRQAERRQEVAVEQAVALAREGGDRDAAFGEGLDIAVDGADANLEAGGEVLGAQLAPGLEFEQDDQQALGPVHVATIHGGARGRWHGPCSRRRSGPRA